MSQKKITIQTNNGRIIINADEAQFKKSKCKGCNKEVYLIKNDFGKPLCVSKIHNDELINHNDDCEYVRYLERKEEAKKRTKKYGKGKSVGIRNPKER